MKQTTVTLIFEKFNLLSDKDFKSWMLNNYDELFEMEKEQIVIAEIETLRVIEKYGISSIEPLINELKNQIETFKSE
jgi:hypothetical protein